MPPNDSCQPVLELCLPSSPLSHTKVKAVPALESLSDNDTFLLVNQDVYLEKIRVFKAGLHPDTLAWHNKIGCAVLFCWFLELL